MPKKVQHVERSTEAVAEKSFMDTLKAWTLDWPPYIEFSGTAGFMLFAASVGNDPVKYSMIYAVFFTMFRYFNCRATFNPALVVSDMLTGATTISNGLCMFITQGFGAALGLYLSIILTGKNFHIYENGAAFDFQNVVLTEFMATGLLVWFWLELHSKKADTWNAELLGLGVFFMYYFAMTFFSYNVGSDGIVSANMNPSRYEAIWSTPNAVAGEWKTYWDISSYFAMHNMTFYMVPVVSSFITTIVHTWYNK